MTLVDTSVWIEHLRGGDSVFAALLTEGVVLTHPFVIGELACGNLKHRAQILTDLNDLPAAIPATHEEVLRLVGDRKFWGEGIGWIDAHLLASALLSNCSFWTLDETLNRSAVVTGVKIYKST
jgi:predicted nucleic acid-binding protein